MNVSSLDMRSEQHSQLAMTASMPDTLIFVDVDGVLNVGIKDEDPAVPALDFSMANLSMCYEIHCSGRCSAKDVEILDKIFSVEACSLEFLGEGYATYGELLRNNPSSLPGLDLIAVFVQRLAMMIRVAGPRRLVVLSSTWRKPQHAKKLQKLEKLIATMLGEPFAFDARTSLEEGRDQAGRLKGIRGFIQDHVASSPKLAGPLRVLVLDDFHNHPLNGWKCDGHRISSAQDAEAYLKNGIPARLPGAVKLIHTYAEWHTEWGHLVQLGTGITMNHFRDGVEFMMTSMKQLVAPQDADFTAAPKKNIANAQPRPPPRLGLENIEDAELDSCSPGIVGVMDACDAEQCSASKESAEEYSSPLPVRCDMEGISVQ
eukprot:TRINITY_DN62842_c0_g1_i1.p1 TRINITY_DN62842_c0_g1~~TRINITY_DN62842_c0_g1_i1.p1  ORF type:complete len:373 (+),score=63.64 TRINITY_DN62842_c0_g1_i1:29-1147(+)